MEVFYYQDTAGNFGDDLNLVIWPKIFSKEMLEVDNVLVIGIGSILSEEWLGHLGPEQQVIVLGSGTSYDMPPRRISDWVIEAVRGPFTAAVIGNPDKAITDGAILLADIPEIVGPPVPREDTILMLHHRTARHTSWEQIATEAGMKYVSPQQPVEVIMQHFAKAKLVITEAMHGAIVADTLRIPWVPIIVSPAIDEFKWRDWCLSMEIPFSPQYVSAGGIFDQLTFARMRRVLKAAGIRGHTELANNPDIVALKDYLARRFSPAVKEALISAGAYTLNRRIITRLLRFSSRFLRARTIGQLASAKGGQTYISDDVIFHDKLQKMREAVKSAERAALSYRRG